MYLFAIAWLQYEEKYLLKCYSYIKYYVYYIETVSPIITELITLNLTWTVIELALEYIYAP